MITHPNPDPSPHATVYPQPDKNTGAQAARVHGEKAERASGQAFGRQAGRRQATGEWTAIYNPLLLIQTTTLLYTHG